MSKSQVSSVEREIGGVTEDESVDDDDDELPCVIRGKSEEDCFRRLMASRQSFWDVLAKFVLRMRKTATSEIINLSKLRHCH